VTSIARGSGVGPGSSGTVSPAPRGPGGRRLGHGIAPAWFVAPSALLFLVFFGWPLVSSLVQSFQVREHGEMVWAGLDNYRRLANDPLVLLSLFNTGWLLLIQVPLMIGLALLIAVLLDQAWVRFRASFRVAYFLPAVTALVAYSIVFRVLLRTDNGVMNQALAVFGLAPIDWLNDPFWARVALIASITWRWTGYNMVILLAGLQAIPRDTYEAASVDGATGRQALRFITLPLLRPVILFTVVTSTIGTLQLFDENFILTRGGPANATLTPVLYLYKIGFQGFEFGYASAIAWLVVAVIGILALLQFRFMGRGSAP
jgi:lactose/L-arabinose transport system permease protein